MSAIDSVQSRAVTRWNQFAAADAEGHESSLGSIKQVLPNLDDCDSEAAGMTSPR